jgi:uncharacterized protein YkwD
LKQSPLLLTLTRFSFTFLTKMQLKTLTAIVSIALTVGVHAVPNLVDRAAGVNNAFNCSHSRPIDISKGRDPGSVSQEWLDAFNSVRVGSGAPPVTWNGTFAAIARDWTSQCKFSPSCSGFKEVLLADATRPGLTPLDVVERLIRGYSLANSPQ